MPVQKRVLILALTTASTFLSGYDCFAQMDSIGLETGIRLAAEGEETVAVWEAGGWVWISHGAGTLSRWRVGSADKPMEVSLPSSIYHIFEVEEEGGWVWIHSEILLRCRVGASDEPQPVELAGKFTKLVRVGAWLWFQAEKGLYRMHVDSSEMPQPVHLPMLDGKDDYEIWSAGGKLWVRTKNGLYWWEAGPPIEPQLVLSDIGKTITLHEVGRWVWVSTDKALFRWRMGSPEKPQSVDWTFGKVDRILEMKGWIWFLASGRMLRWREDGVTFKPQHFDVDGREVQSAKVAGGRIWIRTDDTLYWWTVSFSEGPKPAIFLDAFEVFVSDIQEAGENVWLTRSRKRRLNDSTYIIEDPELLRWRIGSPGKPQRVELGPREFVYFYSAGGCLWIRSRKHILQIDIKSGGWNPEIRPKIERLDILYPSAPIPVKWTISKFGRRTEPDAMQSRIVLYNNKGDVVNSYNIQMGVFEYTIEAPVVGNYSIVVEAVDIAGEVARSRPLEFHVYATVWQVIGEWLVRLLIAYLVLNMLMFLGLIVTSRWSGHSLKFLTSRGVLRFGLWYGLALRLLPPLQVWVLARYYCSARRGLKEPTHAHVPRVLSRPEPPGLLTTDLLDEFRREGRIWVTGGPGTGKTDTVGEVLREYFARTGSEWSGWWQFRFVPVLVHLRDTPEASLDRILEALLSGHGMSFGNEQFARRFVRSAPFLFILDGVNEARLHHRQLEVWLSDFLQTAPRARILATSQTLEGSGNLLRYQMPPLTGEFARDLLRAFLGEASGTAAYAAAPPDLWDGPDKLTAYEVRQVADLARGGRPVPGTRAELYRATVEGATEGFDRPEAVRETLSRLAWNAWLEGKYRFSVTTYLPEPLPLNLLGPVLVRRGVGTDGNVEYEFVHELMMAYLAARWAVVYAISPVARLDDEEVWRPSPSRTNQAFFAFLAELLRGVEEMHEVAEFALEAEKLRVELLTAVKEVARRRGVVLHLSTGPERVEYVEALCHITEAQLDTIIITLGLNGTDFPSTAQRARANALFSRSRRLRRLPELREQIRCFYPDAPLFARYPQPSN
jgi:hypothetical protein